jgi:hypothetical protein
MEPHAEGWRCTGCGALSPRRGAPLPATAASAPETDELAPRGEQERLLVQELEGPRHAFPARAARVLVRSASEAVALGGGLSVARTRARQREIPLGGPADLALEHAMRELRRCP